MKPTKIHTTNYKNTLIEVAPDFTGTAATTPEPFRGKETIATLQYAMLSQEPNARTSDEVLFEIHCLRQEVPAAAQAKEREAFFSKGQPCLRTSPLAKSYGWGLYHDAEGRVKLVAFGDEEYAALQADAGVAKVKAMAAARK